MAWVLTVSLDPDKTDVGAATAIFTDTDGTQFTYSERLRATAGVVAPFRDRAIAARNTWQSRKTTQAGYITTFVTSFGAAGETATAGVST
jgi:hypothetical protein